AEHGVEVPLDRCPMYPERGVESVSVGEAAGAGDRGALACARRNIMRLGIVAVLEAMLETAQEHVPGGKLAHRGAREQPTRAQRGERGQRAAQTKGGLAAGAHELQSLHDELDLANAAGPELDVALVALAPSLLADLAVDVAQACVCVE